RLVGGHRVSAEEADAARLLGGHLDVGDLRPGHQHGAALVVDQGDRRAVGDRAAQPLDQRIGLLLGLEHDLARGVLDADTDLHDLTFSPPRGRGRSLLCCRESTRPRSGWWARPSSAPRRAAASPPAAGTRPGRARRWWSWCRGWSRAPPRPRLPGAAARWSG